MDVIAFPVIYKPLVLNGFYCMALFHSQTRRRMINICIHTDIKVQTTRMAFTIIYFNPLYTHRLFLLVSYNILGIVHCTYLGVSGYNIQNILYSLSEDLFTFTV